MQFDHAKFEQMKNMDPAKWESMCRRCGLCCLVKYATADGIYYSREICHLFDHKTNGCSDYENRLCTACRKVTPELVAEKLMPTSCAYSEMLFGPSEIKPNIDISQIPHAKRDYKSAKKINQLIIPESILWNIPE